MNGAHDLGGMHGFGPIVAEPQDIRAVFHADWERSVFSVSHRLVQSGHWSLDQFRSTIEQQPPSDYLRHSYYENWLGAIEKLVVEHRLLTRQELASGKPAHRDPAPQPEWQPSASGRGCGGSFEIGDTVRVRNEHPVGHTRAPRYTRGHVGEIVAYDGPQPIPERRGQERLHHRTCLRRALRVRRAVGSVLGRPCGLRRPVGELPRASHVSDQPKFTETWQAEAHAMVTALIDAGRFSETGGATRSARRSSTRKRRAIPTSVTPTTTIGSPRSSSSA